MPPSRLTYSVIYSSSKQYSQMRALTSFTPKTTFRTKQLYVFGEDATAKLEKATTEIR